MTRPAPRQDVPARAHMDDLIEVMHGLQDLEADSQRGPRIVSQAYKERQQTKRVLDEAKAQAHLQAKSGLPGKPTVADIEAYVTLHTKDEREAADVAEAAHRYASDRADEIESRRSSLQTRAKLVMEQMRLAGYGGTP